MYFNVLSLITDILRGKCVKSCEIAFISFETFKL